MVASAPFSRKWQLIKLAVPAFKKKNNSAAFKVFVVVMWDSGENYLKPAKDDLLITALC